MNAESNGEKAKMRLDDSNIIHKFNKKTRRLEIEIFVVTIKKIKLNNLISAQKDHSEDLANFEARCTKFNLN